ncbi:GDP-L-fucose synthase [Longimicrobium sp.]|uniref:GDP-L-fucose synthase n=1 Tax=Longimicrobium sp. TaxID=2029185 RepID=UPI002E372A56|nr:GDP-L-fucose synthase [Longimicrobium sp.]HEX6041627.1 GDP-L-fucose synthase [Longimicrobium sp.]
MNRESKIYVAGHRGLVGSALVRRLEALGYNNLVYRTREQLDLEDPRAVREFFEDERPEYVFLAAARVGGIWANDTYPADFIRSNLVIQLNVVDAAWRTGVEKLVFLGSSCIYPKHAPQPIREEYLLSGALEPTNDAYAVAKIAGIKLCQSYNRQYGTRFVSVMPTNLYGPGDNFDLKTSHVLPALVRKFHEARLQGAPEVVVWGSGQPRREFLHVDDMADACVFVMREYEDVSQIINIGCGEDVSIAEAAALVRETVGYEGRIVYDRSKPDGTPRKLLDISRLRDLGWSPSIPLDRGLADTYAWFLEHGGAREHAAREAGAPA